MQYLISVSFGLFFGYIIYYELGVDASFLKICLVLIIFCLVIIFLSKKVHVSKSVLLLVLACSISLIFGAGYAGYRSQKSFTGNSSGTVLIEEIHNTQGGISGIGDIKESGDKVSFTAFAKVDLKPGDLFSFKGEINRKYIILPERSKGTWESFNYRNYLLSEGVSYNLRVKEIDKNVTHEITKERIAYNIRLNILSKLKGVMNDKYAGVVTAMLLGDDNYLDKSIKDIFKKSGTSHILVFSGFNFIVLISAFSFVIKNLKKKFKVLLSIVFSLLILVVVPTSAPTARAGMSVLYLLLANIFNKNHNSKYIFWFFTLSFLIFSPVSSVYSASFHLTFLATFTIIYSQKIIEKITNFNFYQYILNIMCIFLFTTPYIVYTFGGVSLLAIFSNLFSLGLSSIIVVFSVFVVLVSFILPILALVSGYILEFLVKLLVAINKVFSSSYFSLEGIDLNVAGLVLCYLSFIIIFYFLDLALKAKPINR